MLAEGIQCPGYFCLFISAIGSSALRSHLFEQFVTGEKLIQIGIAFDCRLLLRWGHRTRTRPTAITHDGVLCNVSIVLSGITCSGNNRLFREGESHFTGCRWRRGVGGKFRHTTRPASDEVLAG